MAPGILGRFCFGTLLAGALLFAQDAPGLSVAEAVSSDRPTRQWLMLRPADDTPVPVAVGDRSLSAIDPVHGSTVAIPAGETLVAAMASRGGAHFAVAHTAPADGQWRRLTVIVRNAAGEQRYRISGRYDADAPMPTLALSDRGALAVGEPASGRITLYDDRGAVARTVTLVPDAEYDIERLLDLTWSRDGERLAAAWTRQGSAPLGSAALNPSGEPEAALFDADGEMMWRAALPGTSLRALLLSPGGDRLAVATYAVHVEGPLESRTTILDARGEALAELPWMFTHGAFSADGALLVAGDTRGVRCVSTANGESRWSRNIAREEGIAVASDMSDDGEWTAVLTATSVYAEGGFRFTAPRLIVTAADGESELRQDFPDGEFRTPFLRFAPDGRALWLGLSATLQRLEVQP